MYDSLNNKQGKELLNFSNKYVTSLEPHLKKLQLSTSNNISSIVEALNSTDSINAKHIDDKGKISTLEDRFNRTLAKYSRTNDHINKLLLENVKVPDKTWQHLSKLNKELGNLVEELKKKINDLVITDMKLYNDLEKHKEQLEKHTNSIQSDKDKISEIKQNFNTVIGVNEDTRLQMKSNWLHYIVWFILAVTVISILIHTNQANRPGQLAYMVILVTMLIIVYSMAIWIYRHT
tara:strand:+ start:272 stop:973 length:702 start_codon:yes stop_codon:yes gene_type:complete